ncbi:MAG: hypothetical protein H8M99_14575 [Gloeobacteraceae cyanobacterium ES-bin-144]|nr:hypothetical protein [Verrucomicrobiales bacterium]
MNHEERANWIRRGFILFLAVCVGAAVWFYPKPKAATSTAPPIHDLEIIHYHLPKNPESEQIADMLNNIGKKYGKILKMTRIDITAHPDLAKAEKVTKPPKVVMMAGEIRACKFQGLWTQPQIERKIEEILRGLKRVGKNWRPDVAGFEAATNAPPTLPAPAQPAKPPQPK